jgi:hypothetical protein
MMYDVATWTIISQLVNISCCSLVFLKKYRDSHILQLKKYLNYNN